MVIGINIVNTVKAISPSPKARLLGLIFWISINHIGTPMNAKAPAMNRLPMIIDIVPCCWTIKLIPVPSQVRVMSIPAPTRMRLACSSLAHLLFSFIMLPYVLLIANLNTVISTATAPIAAISWKSSTRNCAAASNSGTHKNVPIMGSPFRLTMK